MGRRTAPPPISWLMQAALSRPKLISLAAGFTDNATLPVEISRQMLDRVLRSPKTGRPALQYGITAGETNLRRVDGSAFAKMDTQACSSRPRPRKQIEDENESTSTPSPSLHSPSRVMITGGSQQLLYMTVEALCDEGDIVLVEDPTYFVFLSILQSRGLRARGVRLERDGLDLAHLEAVLQRLKKSGELRRVKVLYLISYFQNPTGVTTSFEKKRGILKLLKQFERAAGHPIYLIEDAAYRELRFNGPDIQSALMAPGAAERVIYTGTYSKPYAPGARVGFGLLPEPLFTAVQRIKGNHDFGTANLLQQLLAGALETGLYDQHVAKIEKRYAPEGAGDEAGARRTFSAECGNLGIRRRTLFLGAPAEAHFHRREIKGLPDRAEKRRALRARGNFATPTTRRGANRTTKCASASAARAKKTSAKGSSGSARC